MNTQINEVLTIQVSKTVEVINQSVYGWFYEEGMSINTLHNLTHNTLSIVVPNEQFHLRIKLSGSKFKKEATLLKIYAATCQKMGIKNIFNINN